MYLFPRIRAYRRRTYNVELTGLHSFRADWLSVGLYLKGHALLSDKKMTNQTELRKIVILSEAKICF